jgi:hypothetical protein
MSSIERFVPTKVEDLGTIVRNFAVQGRALVEAVNVGSSVPAVLPEWYSDFTAGIDHKLGATLAMYAKGQQGFKWDIHIGGSRDFDTTNRFVKPRTWHSGSMSETIQQIRQGNRKGPLIGARMDEIASTTNWVGQNIYVYDETASHLEVSALMPGRYYMEEFKIEDGLVTREEISTRSAFSRLIRTVESMPGIIPLTTEVSTLGAIDTTHRELPPAQDL